MKHSLVFGHAALLGCLITLATAPAYAESGDASASARRPRMAAKLEQRFQAADANHDGKLTREEAEAKMPMVAKNFDAIDTEKAGAISLDAIKQYMQSTDAARKRGGAG